MPDIHTNLAPLHRAMRTAGFPEGTTIAGQDVILRDSASPILAVGTSSDLEILLGAATDWTYADITLRFTLHWTQAGSLGHPTYPTIGYPTQIDFGGPVSEVEATGGYADRLVSSQDSVYRSWIITPNVGSVAVDLVARVYPPFNAARLIIAQGALYSVTFGHPVTPYADLGTYPAQLGIGNSTAQGIYQGPEPSSVAIATTMKFQSTYSTARFKTGPGE